MVTVLPMIHINKLFRLTPQVCILPSLTVVFLDQHCLSHSTFLVGSWLEVTKNGSKKWVMYYIPESSC